MLTSWGARAPGLTDGQVVTLLVGVGLDLADRHALGRVHGPVHPAHVVLDARGRPRLVGVVAPAGWTPRDDWVSLCRLGRMLGRGSWASALTWDAAGRRQGIDLLRWLLGQRPAEPLAASMFARPLSAIGPDGRRWRPRGPRARSGAAT